MKKPFIVKKLGSSKDIDEPLGKPAIPNGGWKQHPEISTLWYNPIPVHPEWGIAVFIKKQP